ncbi:glycosyltransferase family 9 protein [Pasteurellaceae bacterium USgator11]|nr:glycosyltransferase family 9 protein [Pasteurellaceae bacterium UScroc12]TNG95999.1 glycosyltransferase family 9 protein [Pasteurellaceae bacterium USgator41]TNG98609.1 glycosyltransferase family 9 protein [Pasteurellaceae bacterium UScroc31]TNG99976.1 glycosyltransferase family 9 protein [Pasteurellaceae bacterium USgator11]
MAKQPLFTQAPEKICILRLSAIGDVCNAIAMVQQIQRYYPSTEITWIVGKTEAQLVSVLPKVKTVVFDKKCGWRGVLAIWQQLKNQRFDALLNMQTALRASLLSLGIKAKYKIGFAKKRAREGQWLFTNRTISEPQNPHVLDGFLAFAQVIGVPPSPPRWDIPLTAADREYACSLIDLSRKNLLICPCSSKAEKDWTVEGYVAVARYAAEQNINVILAGSPAPREVAMAAEIAQKSGIVLTNVVGKTSLLQLMALIDSVDLLISPDSGPAHMATTQGTPVIGLYAVHNPLRTAPYNNLANVVSVYEQNIQAQYGKPSAELPWATRAKGKDLMQQIQAQEVIAQMKGVLGIS